MDLSTTPRSAAATTPPDGHIWWFAMTAACVAGGATASAAATAHDRAGHFRTPLGRAFNAFSSFTIDSNDDPRRDGVAPLALKPLPPRQTSAAHTHPIHDERTEA